MIVIDCLRAHGMGEEEFSQLRAVLSGFEPKCACDAQRGYRGGVGGWTIRMELALPITNAKALAVGGGRAGGGVVIVVEVG